MTSRTATAFIIALWLIVAAAILTPHPVAQTRYAHHDNRWRRLAHCESTHRWHIDNGGLQIVNATWQTFGGRRFPPDGAEPTDAGEATRRQQRRVGHRIATDGWHGTAPQGGTNAWPYCWQATR